MNDVKVLNEFYRTYNSDTFLADFETILENSDEENKKLTDIKAVIEKEIKVFETLKSQIANISNLFDLPTRVGLSSQLDTVIGDLKNTQNILDSYLAGELTKEKVEESFSKLGNSLAVFSDIYAGAYKKFGETLYFAFKTNTITLNDLEDMKKQENMSPEQVEDIDRVIERIKVELGPTHTYDVNMAEQTAVKDEKGKKSSNTDPGSEEVANQQESIPSLSEKLDSIEYQSGVNYADEVTIVRTETELEKISAQIERLKAKEKLTFSEAIKLQALIKQSLFLEEMAFKQSRNQARREDKMARIDSKIDANAEKLEQEKQTTADSKLFRYMSARKQQKLEEKLKKLEGKLLMTQKEQRRSTLVRFDKTNNRLARKAKRQATRQVIMTTTRENVEKLKAFGRKIIRGGKNVINEGKNVASDVQRFVHNSALMEKLRGRELVMESEPTILELPEEETLVAHM